MHFYFCLSISSVWLHALSETCLIARRCKLLLDRTMDLVKDQQYKSKSNLGTLLKQSIIEINLKTTIAEMGFHCTAAIPNIKQWLNTKPDRFRCYEFILAYVDNVLIMSHSPRNTSLQGKHIMNRILPALDLQSQILEWMWSKYNI